MSAIVYIINGPNLNLLGKRQPEVYGHDSLEDLENRCRSRAEELGFILEFYQSNAEHKLIDCIHKAREHAAGIIINPAAFSHTSIAILDALQACSCPIIEVHLSNIQARESFRHHSYVSCIASGIIAGCGIQGYCFALERLDFLINRKA